MLESTTMPGDRNRISERSNSLPQSAPGIDANRFDGGSAGRPAGGLDRPGRFDVPTTACISPGWRYTRFRSRHRAHDVRHRRVAGVVRNSGALSRYGGGDAASLLQLWMFATPVVYPHSSVVPASWLVARRFESDGQDHRGFRRAYCKMEPPDFERLAIPATSRWSCCLSRSSVSSASKPRSSTSPDPKATADDRSGVRIMCRSAIGFATMAPHATEAAARCARRSAPLDGGSDEFWALRDVTFEVARGETLGLIGHNGAGKSTILKLLSQRHRADHRRDHASPGRLAALIEVGSGFHPELTGRENVYLSGSLLGMRRREIQTKFDRIVEFAGVRSSSTRR